MFWKRFLFFIILIGGGTVLSYLISIGMRENLNNINDIQNQRKPDEGYVRVFSSGQGGTNLGSDVIYSLDLKSPMLEHFYILSQFEGDKWIKLKGDKKIIGVNGTAIDLIKGDYAVAQSSFLLKSGRYIISAENPFIKGELTLYVSNEKPDLKTYRRLLMIDEGDLNNPPEGYENIYSSNSGIPEKTNVIIYSFNVGSTIKEAFSIYGKISEGKLSVRLKGGNIRDFEFINENHPMSDQCSLFLEKGSYSIWIFTDGFKGRLAVFRKKPSS